MTDQARWVAVDLRMHDNEPSVVDPASEVQTTQQALVDALGGAHRLVGTSASGRQSLTFCVTSDLDALVDLVREAAPKRGVASLTALVWLRDPRLYDSQPDEVVISEAHPRARGLGPGYDELLDGLLRAKNNASEPSAN